jgi:pyruvate dehydrogenase E1 component
MFGFQRIGDLIWAAATCGARASCSAARPAARRWQRRRPAAPGRHSHVLALPCPNLLCSYDPAFAYELAVDHRDGIKRMYEGRKTSSTTSP